MSPDPSYIKTNRHRQRQRREIPPLLICPDCGRTIIRAAPDGVCSRCRKRTPAGRAAEAARGRRRRLKQKPPGRAVAEGSCET
jgi:ribosomal protein L32